MTSNAYAPDSSEVLRHPLRGLFHVHMGYEIRWPYAEQ